MYGDFPRDFPTISTTYLKVQAGYTGVGIWHVLQQNNHYCTQYYSNSTLTSCAMASEWTDARQSSSDDTKTVSLWEKCRLGWLLDHITCTHLFNFFACVIGSPLSPYSNNIQSHNIHITPHCQHNYTLTSGSKVSSEIFLKSSMELEVSSARLRKPLAYSVWGE